VEPVGHVHLQVCVVSWQARKCFSNCEPVSGTTAFAIRELRFAARCAASGSRSAWSSRESLRQALKLPVSGQRLSIESVCFLSALRLHVRSCALGEVVLVGTGGNRACQVAVRLPGDRRFEWGFDGTLASFKKHVPGRLLRGHERF
jgi:hypothetical protein